MVDYALVCHCCGLSYSFEPRFESCQKCRGPLDVEIDIRSAYKQLDSRALDCSGGNIWKFAPLLPLKNAGHAVTLGEGGTPLLRHQRLNATLGLPNLFIKNEASNPTWSFKDRLNSVNAGLAVEFGYSSVVALSTGNHGASAAAYAAAAGVRSAVLLPKGTPDVFGYMIQAYGGTAILTEWQGRSHLLTHLVRNHGWYPSKSALPTPISNPFGLQAYKTIAYEIMADMHPEVPDYLFAPVGSGDALYGIFKGFSDLMQIGRIDRIPRLVACEASASNPVAVALDRRSDHVVPVADPKTIAISISEGVASDHALRALRATDGFAVSSGEPEIVDAMRVYAFSGIAAESSSCVPLAGLRRLLAEGRISGDAKIVLILTSAGIKWPDQLAGLASPAVSIDPSPHLLDALLFGEKAGGCFSCAR